MLDHDEGPCLAKALLGFASPAGGNLENLPSAGAFEPHLRDDGDATSCGLLGESHFAHV